MRRLCGWFLLLGMISYVAYAGFRPGRDFYKYYAADYITFTNGGFPGYDGVTLTNVIALIPTGRNYDLVIDGPTWVISNNVTIPANVRIIKARGTDFSILAGNTMTVSTVYYEDTFARTSSASSFLLSGTSVSNLFYPVNNPSSYIMQASALTPTGAVAAYMSFNGGTFTGAIQATGMSTPTLDILGNTRSGTDASIAGGTNNTASGNWSTVAGGHGNTANGAYSSILGGNTNRALGLGSVVGGGLLNTTTGSYSTVSGGKGHSITENYGGVGSGNGNFIDALASFIGGGENNTILDTGTDTDYGTIGGGQDNIIRGGDSTTIAGGFANEIHGAPWGSIGGGELNLVHTGSASRVCSGNGNRVYNANFASIVGGGNNENSGFMSFIGGGQTNIVSGQYSVIPGGRGNVASANYTFSAGRRSLAEHIGTFVFSDSSVASFASQITNSFIMNFSGGVGINTNHPRSTLHVDGVIQANEVRTDNRILGHRPRFFTNIANNITMPLYQGDMYYDSTSNALFIATGTATNTWRAITTGP